MTPHLLPSTTHSYLARAAESLSEAVTATEATTRYACAHVAALRAAAALLAARARPSGGSRGRRRLQKNAWVLLAEVAPGSPASATAPSEPITAWAGLDCHHAPVSTQCASTARTFHSRPRHRNCWGPSAAPGPIGSSPPGCSTPRRTSTGSA